MSISKKVIYFIVIGSLVSSSVYTQTKYRRPSGADIPSSGNVLPNSSHFMISSFKHISSLSNIAVDTVYSKLYVAYPHNHRVFRYNLKTFNKESEPEAVFGQESFYASVRSLGARKGGNYCYGIAVDKYGNLYVGQGAETPVRLIGGFCIKRYDRAYEALPLGTLPDAIIGLPSFETRALFTEDTGALNDWDYRDNNTWSISDSTFREPYFLTVDDQNSLYVADRSNYRILRIDNAHEIAYGGKWQQVLGQGDFNTRTSLVPSRSRFNYVNGLSTSKGGKDLYVADRSNRRWLVYRNVRQKVAGANADLVIGQVEFDRAQGRQIADVQGQDYLFGEAGSVAYDHSIDALYLGNSSGDIYRIDNISEKKFVSEAPIYADRITSINASYIHGLQIGSYGRLYVAIWTSGQVGLISPTVKFKIDETTIRRNVVVGDTFSVVVKIVDPNDADTYMEAMDSITVQVSTSGGSYDLLGTAKARMSPGMREVRVKGLRYPVSGNISLRANVEEAMPYYLEDVTDAPVPIAPLRASIFPSTDMWKSMVVGKLQAIRMVFKGLDGTTESIATPTTFQVQVDGDLAGALKGNTQVDVAPGDTSVDLGMFYFNRPGTGRVTISSLTDIVISPVETQVTVTQNTESPNALLAVSKHHSVIRGDTASVVVYLSYIDNNNYVRMDATAPVNVIITGGSFQAQGKIEVGGDSVLIEVPTNLTGLLPGENVVNLDVRADISSMSPATIKLTVLEPYLDHTMVSALDTGIVVVGQDDFNSSELGTSKNRLSYQGGSYIAIDEQNRKLYVSDPSNNRVLRFSLHDFFTGASAEMVFGQRDFTSKSPGITRMDGPTGMVVDADGNLYVVDDGNSRILRYNRAFEKEMNDMDANTYRSEGVSPDIELFFSGALISGITLDKYRNLYVTNKHAFTFTSFSVIRIPKDEIERSTGNGYQANSDLNLIISGMGTEAPYINSVRDVTYDHHRDILYIAGAYKVFRYDNISRRNGDVIHPDAVFGQSEFDGGRSQLTRSGLSNVYGISVDERGTLYIADYSNYRVIVHHHAYAKRNGADADGIIGNNRSYTRKDVVLSRTTIHPHKVVKDNFTGALYVGGDKRVVAYAPNLRLEFVGIPKSLEVGKIVSGIKIVLKKGSQDFKTPVDLVVKLKRKLSIFETDKTEIEDVDVIVPKGSSYITLPDLVAIKGGTLVLEAKSSVFKPAQTSVILNPLSLSFDESQGETFSYLEGQAFNLKVNIVDGSNLFVRTPSDIQIKVDTVQDSRGIPLLGDTETIVLQGQKSGSVENIRYTGQTMGTQNLLIVARAEGYVSDTIRGAISRLEPTHLKIQENYALNMYAEDYYPVTIEAINREGGRSNIEGDDYSLFLFVKQGVSFTQITDIIDQEGNVVTNLYIPSGQSADTFYIRLKSVLPDITESQTFRLHVRSSNGDLRNDESDQDITISLEDLSVFGNLSMPNITVPFLTDIVDGVVDEVRGKVYFARSNVIYRYDLDDFYTGAHPEGVIGQVNYQEDISSATDINRFSSLSSLAIDPDGNLFAVDRASHRVLRFSASKASSSSGLYIQADRVLGQTLFQNNVAGSSERSMNEPSSVSVDKDGNVFVTDVNNKRVLVFLASSIHSSLGSGSSLAADIVFTGFSNPISCDLDLKGTLYVADSAENKIYVLYQPTAKLSGVNAWDWQFENIENISKIYIDHQDRMFVSSGGSSPKLLIYSSISSRLFPTPDRVIDMDVNGVFSDIHNRLYIADKAKNYVARYSKDIHVSLELVTSNVVAGSAFELRARLDRPAIDNLIIRLDTVSTSFHNHFLNEDNLDFLIPKGSQEITISVMYPLGDPNLSITAIPRIDDYKQPTSPLSIDVRGIKLKIATKLENLNYGEVFDLAIQAINPITGNLTTIQKNITIEIDTLMVDAYTPVGVNLSGDRQALFGIGESKIVIKNLSYNGDALAIKILIKKLDGYEVDTTSSISLSQGIPLSLSIEENYRLNAIQGGKLSLTVAAVRDDSKLPVLLDEEVEFQVLLQDGSKIELTSSIIPKGSASTIEEFIVSELGFIRIIARGKSLFPDTTKVINVLQNIPRLYTNGPQATHVIGQPNFTSDTRNNGKRSKTSLYSPSSVVVDEVNKKVYVSDYGNSRILRYDLDQFVTGGGAEAVFGQPNFNENVYRNTKTDLFTFSPDMLSIDKRNGRLYVIHHSSNRVVWFDEAYKLGDNPPISGVLGQTSVYGSLSGSTLNKMDLPLDIEVDNQGNVYVVDSDNYRVLKFDADNIKTGASASVVLGKPKSNILLPGGGSGAVRLGNSSSLAIDNDHDRLYVLDNSSKRVVRYDNLSSKESGDPIDGQFYIHEFEAPIGSSLVSPILGSTRGLTYAKDRLYISDLPGNRVIVIHLPHAQAPRPFPDGVFGQADFVKRDRTLDVEGNILSGPRGVFILHDGSQIYIADGPNNRVLVYNISHRLSITEAPFNIARDITFDAVTASFPMNPPITVEVINDLTGLSTSFPNESDITLKALVGEESRVIYGDSSKHISSNGVRALSFNNVNYPIGGSIRIVAQGPGLIPDTTDYNVAVSPLRLEFTESSYSVSQFEKFPLISIVARNVQSGMLVNVSQDVTVKLDVVSALETGYVEESLNGETLKTMKAGTSKLDFSSIIYPGSTSQIKLRASAEGFVSRDVLVNVTPIQASKVEIEESYRTNIVENEYFYFTVYATDGEKFTTVSADTDISISTLSGYFVASAVIPSGHDHVVVKISISEVGIYKLQALSTTLIGDTTESHIEVLSDEPGQFLLGEGALSVIGKKDFSLDLDPTFEVSNRTLNGPQDIAIDINHAKVYVSDRRNNRVLRYSISNFYTNSEAESVLGQENFTSNSSGLSKKKMSIPSGLAVNANGTLFVADYGNNRVLRFDQAYLKSNGDPADGVLGQSSYSLKEASAGAAGMRGPFDVTLDDNGALYVADKLNNRVLKFSDVLTKLDGARADFVYGQPSFSSVDPRTSLTGLRGPSGISAKGNYLFVADEGNSRVVRFSTYILLNGTAANLLLGQTSYASFYPLNVPNAASMNSPSEVFLDLNGTLYVSDALNNRILRFRDVLSKRIGDRADLVFGQDDFTKTNQLVANKKLARPSGVGVDRYGRLYVVDRGNNRVLCFGPQVGIKTDIGNLIPYAGESIDATAHLKYLGGRFDNQDVASLTQLEVTIDTLLGKSIGGAGLLGNKSKTVSVGGSVVEFKGLSYAESGETILETKAEEFKSHVESIQVDSLKIVALGNNDPDTERKISFQEGSSFNLTVRFVTRDANHVAFPSDEKILKFNVIPLTSEHPLPDDQLKIESSSDLPYFNLQKQTKPEDIVINGLRYDGAVPFRMVMSTSGLISDTIAVFPEGGFPDKLLLVEEGLIGPDLYVEQGEVFDVVVRSIKSSDGKSYGSRSNEDIELYGVDMNGSRVEFIGNTTKTLEAGKDSLVFKNIRYDFIQSIKLVAAPLNRQNSFLQEDESGMPLDVRKGVAVRFEIVDIPTETLLSRQEFDVKVVAISRTGIRIGVSDDVDVTLQHGISEAELVHAAEGRIQAGNDSIVFKVSYNSEVDRKHVFFNAIGGLSSSQSKMVTLSLGSLTVGDVGFSSVRLHDNSKSSYHAVAGTEFSAIATFFKNNGDPYILTDLDTAVIVLERDGKSIGRWTSQNTGYNEVTVDGLKSVESGVVYIKAFLSSRGSDEVQTVSSSLPIHWQLGTLTYIEVSDSPLEIKQNEPFSIGVALKNEYNAKYRPESPEIVEVVGDKLHAPLGVVKSGEDTVTISNIVFLTLLRHEEDERDVNYTVKFQRSTLKSDDLTVKLKRRNLKLNIVYEDSKIINYLPFDAKIQLLDADTDEPTTAIESIDIKLSLENPDVATNEKLIPDFPMANIAFGESEVSMPGIIYYNSIQQAKTIKLKASDQKTITRLIPGDISINVIDVSIDLITIEINNAQRQHAYFPFEIKLWDSIKDLSVPVLKDTTILLDLKENMLSKLDHLEITNQDGVIISKKISGQYAIPLKEGSTSVKLTGTYVDSDNSQKNLIMTATLKETTVTTSKNILFSPGLKFHIESISPTDLVHNSEFSVSIKVKEIGGGYVSMPENAVITIDTLDGYAINRRGFSGTTSVFFPAYQASTTFSNISYAEKTTSTKKLRFVVSSPTFVSDTSHSINVVDIEATQLSVDLSVIGTRDLIAKDSDVQIAVYTTTSDGMTRHPVNVPTTVKIKALSSDAQEREFIGTTTLTISPGEDMALFKVKYNYAENVRVVAEVITGVPLLLGRSSSELRFVSEPLGARFITVADGDWSDKNIWKNKSIPGVADTAEIWTNVVLNQDVNVKRLFLADGMLSLSSHDLSIGNEIDVLDGILMPGNGRLIFLSHGDALMLPEGIRSFHHLISYRKLVVNHDIKVKGDLTIENTLNMQGNLLWLEGKMLSTSGKGTLSDDAMLTVAPSNQNIDILKSIKGLGMLTIIAENGSVKISNDITISDKLDIVKGSLAFAGASQIKITVLQDMDFHEGNIIVQNGQKNNRLSISQIDATTPVMLIPEQFTFPGVLEVNRVAGVRMTSDRQFMKVTSLDLQRGFFDMKSGTISLETLVLGRAGIKGEMGASGYRLQFASDQSITLPSNLHKVNKLTIKNTGSTPQLMSTMSSDLVVLDTLSLEGVLLTRDEFNILAGEFKGNSLTNINPPLYNDATASGMALDFLEQTKGILTDKATLLNPSLRQLTIESWIKRKKGQNKNHYLVERIEGEKGYKLFVNSRGKVGITLNEANTVLLADTEFTLREDVWYHLAVTYGSGILTVYVNSVLVYASSAGLNMSAVNANTVIGRGWQGALDDVRLWDRVRTADEIKLNMAKRLHGKEAGLVGYYTMDNGVLDFVYDRSESQLHATGINDILVQWVKSQARIGEFHYTPTSQEDITLTQGVKSNAVFLNLQNLKITSENQNQENKITGVFYKKESTSSQAIKISIDSIKQTVGYWEIMVQDENPSTEETFFEIPINNLSIGTFPVSRVQQLILVYRYSRHDPWRLIGQVNDGVDLKTVEPIPLKGRIEIAVAVRAEKVSTAQAGKWSDDNTWVNRIIPTEKDLVEIKHSVLIDRDVKIRGLVITSQTAEVNAEIGASYTITVTDSISTVNNATGDNGGFSQAIRLQLEGIASTSTPPIIFPKQIDRLSEVSIKQKDVQLEGNLTITSKLLLEEDAKINLNGNTITLNGDIEVTTNRVFLEGNGGEVKISGVGKRLTWPKALKTIESLAISRSNGVKLESDLIVSNLDVSMGVLERGHYGILTKVTPRLILSNNIGLINPPLRLDSVEGIRALEINQPISLSLYEPTYQSISSGVTIEAWAKVNNVEENSVVFSKKNNSGQGYELRVQDKKVVFFVTTDKGMNLQAESNPSEFALGSGKWYHLAGVYKQDTAFVFINGVRAGYVAREKAGNMDVNNAVPFIGGSQQAGDTFSGEIDELRVWRLSRHDTLIRKDMAKQIDYRKATGLVAYYTMNEGWGDRIYSSTSDPMGVSINSRFTQSRARISERLPKDVFSSLVEISEKLAQIDFPSAVKELSILDMGSEGGKLYVGYSASKPDVLGTVPIGINSFRESSGYWKIVNMEKGKPDLSNVRIAIPTPSLGEIPITEVRSVAILYRKNISSSWKSLDGRYVKGDDFEKDFIVSSDKLDLEGYTEVIIGIRPFYSQTKSDGDWSDVNTWKAGFIPKEDNSPEVLHKVTLKSDAKVRSLSLSSLSSTSSSGQLTVTGGISLEVLEGLSINEGATLSFEENSTLLLSNSQDITIPKDLRSVYNLYINTSATVTLTSSIEIRGELLLQGGSTLLIDGGKLIMNGGSINIQNGSIYSKKASLTAKKSLVLPSQVGILDSLVIDMADGESLTLTNDLIVRGEAFLKNGLLDRKEFFMLASNLRQDNGEIKPPIEMSTYASISALDLKGEDQAIVPKSALPLSSLNFINMTTEAWVKGSKGRVFSKTNGDSKGWIISILDDGKVSFEVFFSDGIKRTVVSDNFKLKENHSYFISAVLDNLRSQMAVYVNAVKVAEQTIPPGVILANATSSPRLVGGNGYKGQVDELRIWRKSLSGEEIKSNLYKQLTGKEDDLEGYYKFNEVVGDTAYDYTINRQNMYVPDLVPSSAIVSSFPLHEVSNEVATFPASQSGVEKNFLNTFTITSSRITKDTRIRLSYISESPDVEAIKHTLIKSVVSEGYWELSNLEGESTFSDAKLSVDLSNVVFTSTVDEDNLSIAIRRAPSGTWNILDGEIRDGTMSINSPVSIEGTIQLSVVSRYSNNVVYKRKVFGEKATDITFNLKFETALDVDEFTFSMILSTDASFSENLITTASYEPKEVNNEKIGTITLPVASDKSQGVEVGKDYSVKVILEGKDIIDTLKNITMVSVLSDFVRATTDEVRVSSGVLYQPMSLMPNDGKGGLLLFKSTVRRPALVSIVEYEGSVIKKDGLPSKALPMTYYWSIDGNQIEFFDGKIYYPLDEIYKHVGDTTSLKWYRRGSHADSWEDVSGGTETVDGKRMFATSLVVGFSDYIILVDRTLPDVIGLVAESVGNVSESDDVSVLFDWTLNTGSDDMTSTLALSEDKQFSNIIESQTIKTSKTPIIGKVSTEIQGLKRESLYYYSVLAHNAIGELTSDTNWVITSFPVEREQYVFKGDSYTFERGNPLKLGENLFMQLSFSNDEEYEIRLGVEMYARVAPKTQSLPDGVQRINPEYWMLYPLKDGHIRGRDTTFFDKSVSRPSRMENIQVGILASKFPSGVDFSSMVWLKRDSFEDKWKVAGGSLSEDIDGNKYFVSSSQEMDVYGAFTIGTRKASEQLTDLVSIREFKAVLSGDDRVSVRWQTDLESSSISGFEILRMGRSEEEVVSSFRDNIGMLARRQAPAFYTARDYLEEGSRDNSAYRIRVYDDYGNIYEYGEEAIVTGELEENYPYEMSQNYPNPFTGQTIIRYKLERAGHVYIRVYDILGRLVETLVDNESKETGEHVAIFDGSKLSPGVYFYKIVTGGFFKTKRMILIR